MAIILGRKPGGSGGGGGAPSGPAGGSLSGTYPDPGIAAGAVDTAEIANDAVDADKIDGADAADIRTLLDVPSNSEAVLDAIFDAKGDLLGASADDTPVRIPVGATNGMVLEVASGASPGVQWDLPSGHEFSYAEITSSVTVSATAAASANDVVTTSAVSYDGSTAVMIEFFAPFGECGSGAGTFLICNLFDGSTDLGRIATVRNVAAQLLQVPIIGKRRLTPSNASHTYNIKAWRVSANGSIGAAAGGTDTTLPAYIRVTKV